VRCKHCGWNIVQADWQWTRMRKRSPEALYCRSRPGIAQIACVRRTHRTEETELLAQAGWAAKAPTIPIKTSLPNTRIIKLRYYGDSALNLARHHKRFENKVATTGNFVNCRRNSVSDADEFRQQSSASAYSNGVCSLDGRSAANYIP
jgi:hypothetical protein